MSSKHTRQFERDARDWAYERDFDYCTLEDCGCGGFEQLLEDYEQFLAWQGRNNREER